MSSSRRKSRSKAATRAPWQCVTCGEDAVCATVGDVVITRARRRHRFKDVPHDLCGECGERYFRLDACRRFDDYFLGRKKSAA